MGRKGRRWSHFALVGLLGCAHVPDQSAHPAAQDQAKPSAPPTVELPALTESGLRAIIDDVALLRGGRWTRTPSMQLLGRPEFLRALRESQERRAASAHRLVDPFLLGFSGYAPDQARSLRAMMSSEMDEQVAGFYDEDGKQLYVRKDLPVLPIGTPDGVRTIVIAHEVAHAWQDQTIGLAGLLQHAKTLDELLALKAVLEGDATLTSILVQAKRSGVDLDAAVREFRRGLETLAPEDLLKLSGSSSRLLALPPIVRGFVLFPYFSGARFAADLYATGGSPLLARVLARPPRTTLAILQPQRFLDGLGGEPAIPAVESSSGGTIGAALLELLLSPCTGAATARLVALPWRGDRFEAGAGGGLTWMLRMEDEAAATLLAQTLGRFPECGGPRRSRPAGVRVVGTRVLFLRTAPGVGLGPALASQEVVDPPELRAGAPPFGQLSIPLSTSLSALEVEHRGTVVEGRYRNAHLGLTAMIPQGATVRLDKDMDLALSGGTGPNFFMGTLKFLAGVQAGPAAMAFLEGAVVSGLTRGRVRPEGVKAIDEGPVDLGWTKGVRKDWLIQDRLHFRMLILEHCAGRGSLVLSLAWASPDAGKTLEGFLGSLRSSEQAPGCAGLVRPSVPVSPAPPEGVPPG